MPIDCLAAYAAKEQLRPYRYEPNKVGPGDVAKYFAIIPAMFAAFYPSLNVINIMHLQTPQSAILSAIIFNALIIIALIPLALRGVKYRPQSAGRLLTRNLLIYGAGGVIIPFIGIKAIDIAINAVGLV